MTATSRNDMRAKYARSARTRFHVYFPIDPVADSEAYAGRKKQLVARIEFCDPNAIDAGRFIHGYNTPSITVVVNERIIDAWLADALDGKIDVIITKSVSHFARNTVDSLTTVRALQGKGVEVFFQKEGIWTFDARG